MTAERSAKSVFGRVVSFALLTLGGGLAQLWVFYVILATQSSSGSIDYGVLLGDGGLFFFSTSLVFTSMNTLLGNRSLRFGSLDMIGTILVCAMMFSAVLLYTSVLAQAPSHSSPPFSGYLLEQIVCSITAVAYAFYVCTVTGFFFETTPNG